MNLAIRVLLAAALLLSSNGCRAPLQPTPEGDTGHWALTKYLVRVYRADPEVAVHAAKVYLQDNDYALDVQRQETKGDEVVHVLHGFTLGGRLAYHLGHGLSLIFRLRVRKDSPGLVAVEAKHGPSYRQPETAAILDGYGETLRALEAGPRSEWPPVEPAPPLGR